MTGTLPPKPAPDHSALPGGPNRSSRQRRGRQNYQVGLAAEEAVANAYAMQGYVILARRHRTPYGEIDLIVRDASALVFVEVKRRKYRNGWDSPVSERQWQRLASAALHYIVDEVAATGVHPVCRFDVAIVASDGKIDRIENARAFDDL